MCSNWFPTVVACALTLASPVFAQQTADEVAPEGASDGQVQALTDEVIAALKAKADGVPVKAKTWMVAAANPLANSQHDLRSAAAYRPIAQEVILAIMPAPPRPRPRPCANYRADGHRAAPQCSLRPRDRAPPSPGTGMEAVLCHTLVLMSNRRVQPSH